MFKEICSDPSTLSQVLKSYSFLPIFDEYNQWLRTRCESLDILTGNMTNHWIFNKFPIKCCYREYCKIHHTIDKTSTRRFSVGSISNKWLPRVFAIWYIQHYDLPHCKTILSRSYWVVLQYRSWYSYTQGVEHPGLLGLMAMHR